MVKKRISLRHKRENELDDSMEIRQAYEFLYSSKKAEGLRENTLKSYGEHLRTLILIYLE